MEIVMNEKLIDIFFGEMDSDSLKEVKEYEKEGNLTLNLESGELRQNGVGLGVYTDYFKDAFFYNSEALVTDEKRVIWATQSEIEDDIDWVRIVINPKGSDGWSSAAYWDKDRNIRYSTSFKVWGFYIQSEEWIFDFSDRVFFEEKSKSFIKTE